MSYQKKTTLVLSILLLACTRHDLAAEPASEAHPITAMEYCDFLNNIPLSDARNCYNGKMGSDPIDGCITQNKTNFHYDVISGRENFPISYVTKNNLEEYFQWLSNQESSKTLLVTIDGIQYSTTSGAAIFSEDDDFLACNKTDVSLITSEAISSLALSDVLQETHPYLKDAGIAVGVVVVLLGGKFLKTTCWDDENSCLWPRLITEETGRAISDQKEVIEKQKEFKKINKKSSFSKNNHTYPVDSYIVDDFENLTLTERMFFLEDNNSCEESKRKLVENNQQSLIYAKLEGASGGSNNGSNSEDTGQALGYLASVMESDANIEEEKKVSDENP